MFIKKEEFKTIIIPEILEKLTNKDDKVLEHIIMESIDEIKGFLQAGNYDVSVFDKTGEQRNLTLLKHLKRICTYELYKRKDHPIDEDTQNAYDETMTWLEKIALGKTAVFGVPSVEDTQETNGHFIVFGSDDKYKTDW
ncbi:DUF1320 family protein [Tenacibaculum sp. 190524A02b]|uniref:DUF1320 family protein n=1 Tax=Tenacibaculum vairaonense TaxID=3137860 RepID=A0ABP1FCW4_9FLAO